MTAASELNELARYYVLGRGLQYEPKVQSEGTTPEVMSHVARVALCKLEWIYGQNEHFARALWLAHVMTNGASPETVALTLAAPRQRVLWALSPFAKGQPAQIGRQVLDEAYTLWEQAPGHPLSLEHRDLNGFASGIDKQVYQCRQQLEEIKHARGVKRKLTPEKAALKESRQARRREKRARVSCNPI